MKFNPSHNTERSEEAFGVFKTCSRFNSLYSHIDEKNAIVYLKLRSDGCDRKTAKNFISKRICMVDTTREKEGPVTSRTLKVRKNPYSWTTHGWKNTPNDYDMGEKYITSHKELLVKEEEDIMWNNHFVKHEDKIKEDYKKKIAMLEKYVDEIYRIQQFSGLKKEDLARKVRLERFRLKTGEVTKTNIDPSTMQFKVPKLDPLNFDENMLVALNLETSANWFKEKEGGSLESMEKLNPPKALTPRRLQRKATLEPETFSSSVDQKGSKIEEPQKGQEVKLEVPLKSHERIEEAADGEESPEMKRNVYQDVKVQTQNLNKLMDNEPFRVIQKKLANGELPPGADEQELSQRNFFKNQVYAKEFNKANYIFAIDDDKETKDKSPTAKNTPRVIKFRKKIAPLKLSEQKVKESEARKKEFEKMAKMLDFEVSLNIDTAILEQKRNELLKIVDNHSRRTSHQSSPASLPGKHRSNSSTSNLHATLSSAQPSPRLLYTPRTTEKKSNYFVSKKKPVPPLNVAAAKTDTVGGLQVPKHKPSLFSPTLKSSTEASGTKSTGKHCRSHSDLQF